MTRATHLRTAFVEFIPERLNDGVLYVSRRFATASHLCCCGCGFEVVTPLNPAKWRLVEHEDGVTLSPSVGNGSFPCRSHYFIEAGRVRWVPALGDEEIAVARARDRADAERLSATSDGRLAGLVARARDLWLAARRAVRRWLDR